MQMSVSPREIAEHLVSELGHGPAIQKGHFHLERCLRIPDSKTADIWQNIVIALNNMPPVMQRN